MGVGRRPRPAIAGLLSGLLPGLGQFYNRRWGRGTGFLLGVLLVDAGFGVTPTLLDALAGAPPADLSRFLLGSLLVLVVAIWSVTDAVRTARARAGRQ
jgi:hypothetical protein